MGIGKGGHHQHQYQQQQQQHLNNLNMASSSSTPPPKSALPGGVGQNTNYRKRMSVEPIELAQHLLGTPRS
jgi:hypothetical protein